MFVLLDSQYLPGGNIAVAVLVINLLKNTKFALPNGKMLKAFVFYIGYLLLVTLIHIKTNYDVSSSLMYFIEIAIILVGCSSALYKINIAAFMKLIRDMGIVLGIFAILEGVIKYPYLSYILNIQCETAYDPSGYRIVSIFGHPIVAGVFFLFCWCALRIAPCKNANVNLSAQIIIILAIVLTRSRSIWLSFVATAGLLFFKKAIQYKNKIPRNILVRVGQIALLYLLLDVFTGLKLSGYIYKFFSSRIIGSLYAGEGAGNIIRIDTVLNSIEYWKNGNFEKLVWGMGKNYDKYFMELFPVVKYSTVWTAAIDNQYFTTLHEAGAIGIIPVLWILIMAIIRIIKSDYDNIISIVANAGIVGIYISMYFYEGLNYMCVLTMLMILMNISDNYNEFIQG